MYRCTAVLLYECWSTVQLNMRTRPADRERHVAVYILQDLTQPHSLLFVAGISLTPRCAVLREPPTPRCDSEPARSRQHNNLQSRHTSSNHDPSRLLYVNAEMDHPRQGISLARSYYATLPPATPALLVSGVPNLPAQQNPHLAVFFFQSVRATSRRSLERSRGTSSSHTFSIPTWRT